MCLTKLQLYLFLQVKYKNFERTYGRLWKVESCQLSGRFARRLTEASVDSVRDHNGRFERIQLNGICAKDFFERNRRCEGYRIARCRALGSPQSWFHIMEGDENAWELSGGRTP